MFMRIHSENKMKEEREKGSFKKKKKFKEEVELCDALRKLGGRPGVGYLHSVGRPQSLFPSALCVCMCVKKKQLEERLHEASRQSNYTYRNVLNLFTYIFLSFFLFLVWASHTRLFRSGFIVRGHSSLPFALSSS